MNRRRFFSALLAAGAAAPALAQQPSSAPQRIDRLRLDAAESLFGVDFNEAEEQMALGSVNRNLDSYEQLRKLNIPLDTEPAITFRPYLPGKKPTGRSTPGAKLKFTRPAVPANLKPEEIAFLPVTALATLIESKRITSTELTKIYLDRLKKYGDPLKCVVTLTEDLALEQAAHADTEIKAGKYRGPLHGIPWGAKDLLATKGIKTTWGATPYKDQVIDLDATVVERLREAGAVLVAKLSMGALAQGGVWFGGSTRNPWNTERSSSGSSAGPGAATAAGLVGFAIGTETLGSIISPSVTNGVTGLRPTYGRVSRHGAMALSWTMDKIGPMCRSVEDCVLVLNAIYGSDGRDDTCTDAPFEWNAARTAYDSAARLTQDRLHPKGVRGRAEQSEPDRRAAPGGRRAQCDVRRGPRCVPEGRREARADGDAGFPQRSNRLRAERGSGRGVRRPDAQPGTARVAHRPVTGRLAEHLPQLSLHSGGGIHPRNARAAAADAGNGQADVAVRRVPESGAGQQQPASDEPDRSPRDRAQERLHRQHAAGDHGDGAAVQTRPLSAGSRSPTSKRPSGINGIQRCS